MTILYYISIIAFYIYIGIGIICATILIKDRFFIIKYATKVNKRYLISAKKVINRLSNKSKLPKIEYTTIFTKIMCFNFITKKIFINPRYFIEESEDFGQFLFCLLHEYKHYLDTKKRPKQLLKEKQTIPKWEDRPCEKRANKFANKVISRLVKKEILIETTKEKK